MISTMRQAWTVKRSGKSGTYWARKLELHPMISDQLLKENVEALTHRRKRYETTLNAIEDVVAMRV